MTEAAEKRRPGRPKGLPKIGGRKAGSPRARLPEELRGFINQRGRPLEFLAAVADGRKVSAADPADPSRKVRVYPSLGERKAAAMALLDRILPALKSTEISGPNGGPIETCKTSDRDIAKVLLTALDMSRGAVDVIGEEVPPPSLPALHAEPAEVIHPEPEPEQARPTEPQGPSVGHVEALDWMPGCIARLDERLPDGRERWTARDGSGRIISTAFGLAALKANVRWKA